MKIFKNKKRKYIIITSLVSIFAVTGLIITYYNFIPKEEPLIGAYIDGTYSETLPSKGSGYKVDKIVCDNNKNASWDYDKWGIKLSNWGTRSRCNIYFKGLESFILDNKTFYLDEMQRCPTMNSDGTVTVTEVESQYGYLCKAKDAYGDSYYYRGNVTNNYVKFADKYWRIVRINGDGTVRVIYDGTSAHTNGEHSTDRQIGTSAFNYYWKRNNIQDSNDSYVYLENAGVGYMYGNADTITETTSYLLIPPRVDFTATSTYYIAKEYTFYESSRKFTLKDQIAVLGSDLTRDYVGYYYTNNPPTSTPYSVGTLYKIMDTESGEYGYVQYGTSSKEVAQTNTNDSTIKTYLDNWYKTNISGTENERYLADNIFCNDRSFDSNNSGTGAGMSVSLYNSPDLNIATFNLKCLQQNDAFTVSDTGNGNGALTYPIGLISADEVVLAGGWNADNNGYYLYSGLRYWTSSPIGTIDNHALIYNVNSSGRTYIDDTETDVSYAGGVRPVLNLSPNVLNNGDGSMDNPYHP